MTNEKISENKTNEFFKHANRSLILYAINEFYDLKEFKIKVESNNKFKLENSKHAFSQIPFLIEYYMSNR